MSQVACQLYYNMVFSPVFREYQAFGEAKFRSMRDGTHAQRASRVRAEGNNAHTAATAVVIVGAAVESITEFMCKFNCLIAFVFITRHSFSRGYQFTETHFNDNFNGMKSTTTYNCSCIWPKLMRHICQIAKIFWIVCRTAHTFCWLLTAISQEVLTCCHLVLINLKLERNALSFIYDHLQSFATTHTEMHLMPNQFTIFNDIDQMLLNHEFYCYK